MEINNFINACQDIVNREAFLQDAIQIIKDNDVQSIAIISLADNKVLTGYYNCDAGTKQLLNSHMQIDIIDNLIRANKERYMGDESNG